MKSIAGTKLPAGMAALLLALLISTSSSVASSVTPSTPTSPISAARAFSAKYLRVGTVVDCMSAIANETSSRTSPTAPPGSGVSSSSMSPSPSESTKYGPSMPTKTRTSFAPTRIAVTVSVPAAGGSGPFGSSSVTANGAPFSNATEPDRLTNSSICSVIWPAAKKRPPSKSSVIDWSSPGPVLTTSPDCSGPVAFGKLATKSSAGMIAPGSGVVPTGGLPWLSSSERLRSEAVMPGSPTSSTLPRALSAMRLETFVASAFGAVGVGATGLISAIANSKSVIASPIAPSALRVRSSWSTSPSSSESTTYGPPTPTNARTLLAPTVSIVTLPVVGGIAGVAPTGGLPLSSVTVTG